MNSIYTVKSYDTRTMTHTLVEFFRSVKFGLKTPYGSPKKEGKNQIDTHSSKSSFKFNSFFLNQQNFKKFQSQRAMRKKRVKEHKLGKLRREKSQMQSTSEKKNKSIITYKDMIKQRIGIEGPVKPYNITKTSFTVHDDKSSFAELISAHHYRSILPLEEEEKCLFLDSELQFKPGFFVQKIDLEMIHESSYNWCPSPSWPGKSIGLRGLRAEYFKTRFRALEKQVHVFQMNSKEIRKALIKNCESIARKQNFTSDFLHYTHIYSKMLAPIEQELNKVEDLLEDKEIVIFVERVQNLEEVFKEAHQRFKNLPEFLNSIWVKKVASDSNLYELNQFCTLVLNHSGHEKQISAQFQTLEEQYSSHDYLMREYIWKIWYHFDIVRRGFSDPSWLRLFAKFKLAIERSTKENCEGHELMNSIIIRKKKANKSRRHIERRLRYIKINLKQF